MTSGVVSRYAKIMAWLVILALAWLLWSGIYKPIILFLGVISCLLTLYLCHRTGFFEASTSIHLLPRIIGY